VEGVCEPGASSGCHPDGVPGLDRPPTPPLRVGGPLPVPGRFGGPGMPEYDYDVLIIGARSGRLCRRDPRGPARPQGGPARKARDAGGSASTSAAFLPRPCSTAPSCFDEAAHGGMARFRSEDRQGRARLAALQGEKDTAVKELTGGSPFLFKGRTRSTAAGHGPRSRMPVPYRRGQGLHREERGHRHRVLGHPAAGGRGRHAKGLDRGFHRPLGPGQSAAAPRG